MFSPVALLLLFAAPQEQTTLPRHPDPDPVESRTARDGEPTDPWFDREYVATDDPAFVLAAVENARQGMMDARSAADGLKSADLRAAAEKIASQNVSASRSLEQIATTKGWRLPQANPARASSVNGDGTARANANFILNQISFHQNTVAHYRAQLSGKGDPDLKRALRDALPGYQKNLEMLLTLKP